MRNPKPFQWTKDHDKILATAERGHQAQDSPQSLEMPSSLCQIVTSNCDGAVVTSSRHNSERRPLDCISLDLLQAWIKELPPKMMLDLTPLGIRCRIPHGCAPSLGSKPAGIWRKS